MQLRVFNGSMYFKDNLKTIEPQFPKKLKTTEAHFEFTGPYKKKKRVFVFWGLDGTDCANMRAKKFEYFDI